MTPVRIIAEAGVNHNGSLDTALLMVDAAAAAGADAVKFQTFDSQALATPDAEKAAYQAHNTAHGGSQRDMLRSLELSREAHVRLMQRCNERGVDFLSTAFDLPSVALLVSLGLKTFKIPSGAITDLPYLRAVGSLGGDVILSTGMATIDEVRAAVEVLKISGTPLARVTLLHCTTEYPTPASAVNLLAMHTLAGEFGTDVGYSDHTEGIAVPTAAVALGAKVIEKHFTLDRSLEGPDQAASLEPPEFANMVASIRTVERALGSSVKAPSAGELENAVVVRKSIVASRAIRAGELFTDENLTTKRPGTGISPMQWDEIVGTNASRDYAPDEMIAP